VVIENERPSLNRRSSLLIVAAIIAVAVGGATVALRFIGDEANVAAVAAPRGTDTPAVTRPRPAVPGLYAGLKQCFSQSGLDIDTSFAREGLSPEEAHRRYVDALAASYEDVGKAGQQEWRENLSTLQDGCIQQVIESQVIAATALDQQLAKDAATIEQTTRFEATRAAWEGCMSQAGIKGVRAIDEVGPFLERHAQTSLDALVLPEIPERPLPGADDAKYMAALKRGQALIVEAMKREDGYAADAREVVEKCLDATGYRDELTRGRTTLQGRARNDNQNGKR